MKITITVRIAETAKQYDISVDNSQRIMTTLEVMHENMIDFPALEDIKEIRYGEQMRRVLPESTYEQAHIFSGDILSLRITQMGKRTENSFEIGENDPAVDFKEICKEEYKKSDFRAKDEFDFAGLLKIRQGLLNCTYIEKEEDILFTYDVYEMSPITEIRKEKIPAKYRFLINIPLFLDVLAEYDIPLYDENIYYDRNYIPYGKKRDIKAEGRVDKVKIYKAFIGAVLGKRYGIEDYLMGGMEIIEREKWFVPYKDLQDIYFIREMLIKELDRYVEKREKSKKEVSRIANAVKTILLITMSVLSITMTGLFIYYGKMMYPLHIDLLNGEKAFLRKEYVTCIDALKAVPIEKMDYETKYILAVSYAKTENLNREEVTNIVDKLSLTSGERELEYWIYLGRGKFDQAEDAAKFLMDDRLLAYAYMKEYNHLESEEQISGEEKEQRMKELESLIEELGKKYTPKE